MNAVEGHSTDFRMYTRQKKIHVHDCIYIVCMHFPNVIARNSKDLEFVSCEQF